MFHKDFIIYTSVVFIVGCLCVVQSRDCYSCEGINCLRTSKATNKATCVDPMDNCVTVFERFTVVARGCYSTLPEEHRNKCDNLSDSECHKCSKSLCNDKGAIYCLQCDSENNNDCQSTISKIESSRCPISTSTNSYCYTRKFSNKVERGCLVHTNEQLKCLGDSSCEMCIADGEDACNRESADGPNSGSVRTTAYGGALVATAWLILQLL